MYSTNTTPVSTTGREGEKWMLEIHKKEEETRTVYIFETISSQILYPVPRCANFLVY